MVSGVTGACVPSSIGNTVRASPRCSILSFGIMAHMHPGGVLYPHYAPMQQTFALLPSQAGQDKCGGICSSNGVCCDVGGCFGRNVYLRLVLLEFEDASRADAVVNIQLHGVEDILQRGCTVGSDAVGDRRVFCMQEERRTVHCNMLLDFE